MPRWWECPPYESLTLVHLGVSPTRRRQRKHQPMSFLSISLRQLKLSAIVPRSESLPSWWECPISKSLTLVRPDVGMSPTWRRQCKHQPTGFFSIILWAVETLRCESVPRLESLLCCRNFLLKTLPSSPLRWWDYPHSKTTVNPTPLLGSFLRSLKFAGTMMGLPPLGDNIANSPRRVVPNQPCQR